MVWHQVSREKFFNYLELMRPILPFAPDETSDALDFYSTSGKMLARFRPGTHHEQWRAHYEILQEEEEPALNS